ncbi:MAG: nitroreductase family protein [Thermomicrobiales bacterium]
MAVGTSSQRESQHGCQGSDSHHIGRAFQDRAVPEPVIREILEAGRLTASSMNKQPCHFVVVQDRAKLEQLAAAAKTGPYIADAPLTIVIVVDHTTWALSGASRAVQDMVLTAWSAGVGSNWVGFIGKLDTVNDLLGISADLDVVTVIPFGDPVDSIGKGKKNRKPLAELVHWGSWGTTSAPAE